MDGRHDVQPEHQHRAPDPSLEEMLRRARDARLGDDQTTPPYASSSGPFLRAPALLPEAGLRVSGLTRFLVGVIVGILLCYGVIQANTTPSTVTSSLQSQLPTQSTATALPTTTPVPTDTPTPTDAPTPYLITVTATELVTLAQNYYNTTGPYTGTYVMMDTPSLQTIYADSTGMTLCVAYQYATVADPNTVVDSDSRWFRYAFTVTAGWAVQGMGSAGSCSLS